MAISQIGGRYGTYNLPNYTLHPGKHRYLLVMSHCRNEGYYYFQSISFGGVAMTLLADTGLGASYNPRVQIFGVVIPDSWSGTKSFSQTSPGTHYESVIEVAGVDPNNPIVATGTDRNSAGNSMNASVTLAALKFGYVYDVIQVNGVGGLAVGAGQSKLYSNSRDGVSRKVISANGNTTMSWTHNQSSSDMAAISLRPKIYSKGVIWFG
jgi:hypothetical protein